MAYKQAAEDLPYESNSESTALKADQSGEQSQSFFGVMEEIKQVEKAFLDEITCRDD